MPQFIVRAFMAILSNWERYLFVLVGGAFLVASFKFLVDQNLAFFSTTFGVSFFCFFYSNLARFKRFKGLGFEAELWEDKQKEAAELIDRLKNVVTVYTREIVMGKVMNGRWGGVAQWRSNWNLYDELVSKHSELGQEIDFSRLKHQMDSVFIFDICSPIISILKDTLSRQSNEIVNSLKGEFGSPITDLPGYNTKMDLLRHTPRLFEDSFERSEVGNLPQDLLDFIESTSRFTQNAFNVSPAFDQPNVDRLRILADLRRRGPLEVTDQLIDWADRTA